MPFTVAMVVGANVVSAFNCAKLSVVAGEMPTGSIVNDVTPKGATKKKLLVTVSPVPAALLPDERSDSSTLASVPATVPSFKAMILGVPTMVSVSVVVDLSPSPSVIS